jgi:iduronate 2-sulfatase
MAIFQLDNRQTAPLSLIGLAPGRPWLAVLCLISWSGLMHGSVAATPPHLNVLFIMADDLGNVANHADRRHPVKTPNLDRFAQTAVTFNRAYCQIPLCNPSRASLFTGLRPDETSVFDLSRHFRDQIHNVETLPELLRDNGWETARVGKIYHYDVPKGIGTNGLDDPLSWDMVFNPKGRDVDDEALITNPTPDRPISAALSWLKAEGTDQEQTDGMIANQAAKWIEENKHAPFFLGVGFFRPHTPFVAPARYFDSYPIDQIQLPQAPPDDRDDIPAAAFAHNNPVPNYGLDEATLKQALQAYYASVSFVDAQIGMVLDALDACGVANHTIVVVCSDHGYHLGEHLGVWQKRTLFEESARTPLIIRVPGAAGNGKPCDQVVEFIDLYPTIAELCTLASTLSLPGQSLMPLLESPTMPWNGVAITQILRPADDRFDKPIMGRSIRTDRYRYTQWDEGRAGEELYDHQNDPYESNNLAAREESKTVIRSLKPLLEAKAKGTVPLTPFDPTRL